jgi:hypothetical protein
MDAASVNELAAAHKRRREQTEAEVAVERGVVGIGDGSGRTWHGGPPVNDHMWVRPGAGFEADGVTPTTAHLARNLSLHEFAEGDPVTLEWMSSARGANMLQIVYRELPILYGLFVEAYTHPLTNQDPENWRILRFTTLPSPTYTDLGLPAVMGGGHQSFMAVAQAALYYGGNFLCRYMTGSGWSGFITYALSLHSGGDRFHVKHNGRVYTVFKTANETISIYRLNTDATSTLIDQLTDASIADDEIVYCSSLTPDGPGRIYIQLGVDDDESASLFRVISWDETFPASYLTLTTSPSTLTERPLTFFERRGETNYAISVDFAGDDKGTLYTGSDPATWAARHTVNGFRDENDEVAILSLAGQDFSLSRFLYSSSFGGTFYEPDADGNLWVTHRDFGGDLDSAPTIFGATVGDAWVLGAFHAGPVPEPADDVTGPRGSMSYLLRYQSAEVQIIASAYTDTPSGLPVEIPYGFHGGVRVGSKVYFSLGLEGSFSDPAFTFPNTTPGGLFICDAATNVVSRFLPVEVLTTSGGCGMMLAHDVTEAAAV